MGEQQMDFLNDEEIFSNVQKLMQRIQKDQQLQELSERNGLDVKNSIRLTADTSNNIATAVVALMLAKRSGDPRYRKLTILGMNKRSLKTEIINSYKDQAIQLITKYEASKNGV